jgi:hypothetical protein
MLTDLIDIGIVLYILGFLWGCVEATDYMIERRSPYMRHYGDFPAPSEIFPVLISGIFWWVTFINRMVKHRKLLRYHTVFGHDC